MAVWVKGNKVYYPNGLQVKKLHKSCTTPKDDWPQYELIKIKCTGRFINFKGYHCFATKQTSLNVPSEVQVKDFFFF